MQKVLRRTHLAKGQAVRKAERAKKVKATNLYRYSKRQQKPVTDEIRGVIRGARKAQREDWTLGALAPKRDVGEQADHYGTVSIRRIQPPVEKGDGWWKDYCIVEGDRVVIVEPGHRDRGRIGTVKEVKMKAEHCVVEGLNEVDVAVPDYMLANEEDKTPRRTVEAPLPLSSVNLVYPLANPTTGELRDIIIKKLARGKVLDEKDPPRRYIADYDDKIRIPYPTIEPEEYKDHDSDTFRIEVEKKTWVPTLIRPPMPPSIIDELRNKYSKFRDRHDEDFVLRKVEEDKMAQQKKTEMRQLMRSPLKELHRRERAEKKAKGKPKLSKDALSIIGQHMTKHKDPRGTGPAVTGLALSTPSHATSSALRSTFAMSNPPAISLHSRSTHSSSCAGSQAMYSILTRKMSIVIHRTLNTSLADVNALLLKNDVRVAPKRRLAPLSTISVREIPPPEPVIRQHQPRLRSRVANAQEPFTLRIRKRLALNAERGLDGVVNAKVNTESENHQPPLSNTTLENTTTEPPPVPVFDVPVKRKKGSIAIKRYKKGAVRKVKCDSKNWDELSRLHKAQIRHITEKLGPSQKAPAPMLHVLRREDPKREDNEEHGKELATGGKSKRP